MTKRAFTLIELLVVIAVIALLMAILMPALNRAKKQAKAAACQMNLHHWGVIWSMYCDNNDGYFCGVTTGMGARTKWLIALRPQYETRSGILKCPMATKHSPMAFQTDDQQGGTFHVYGRPGGFEEGSYGINCWIYKPRPGATIFQAFPDKNFWKTKDVKGGNKIPVFADSMWRGGFPREVGGPGDPPQFDDQWFGEIKVFCINRHNGSTNHLFMDWSVRKVGLKELWKLKWHREFDTRGPWTTAGGVAPSDWPKWMRRFKDY